MGSRAGSEPGPQNAGLGEQPAEPQPKKRGSSKKRPFPEGLTSSWSIGPRPEGLSNSWSATPGSESLTSSWSINAGEGGANSASFKRQRSKSKKGADGLSPSVTPPLDAADQLDMRSGATAPVSDEPLHVNVAAKVKAEPRQLQACRGCRRAKVKCESQEKQKCRRCSDQELECVYETVLPPTNNAADVEWKSSIENRLDRFGAALETISTLLTRNMSLPAPGVQLSPDQRTLMNSQGIPNQLLDHTHANQRVDFQFEPTEALLNGFPTNPTTDPSIPSSLSTTLFKSEPSPQGPDMPFDDIFGGHGVATDLDYAWDAYEYAPGVLSADHTRQPSEAQKTPTPFESNQTDPRQESLSRKSITPSRRDVEPGKAQDLDRVSSAVVTPAEAKDLFEFFNEKIAHYLFGFPISQTVLPSSWERPPILVTAICTVAAIHHPKYNTLFEPLKTELHQLAQEVLFKPFYSEAETIDTIIALCVAGFWLPESFMLTAVALRLAKDLGLNLVSDPRSFVDGDRESTDPDRLRLWYLLYILDGHQSLTSNRSPLIPGDDDAASRSRGLLLNSPEASEFIRLSLGAPSRNQQRQHCSLDVSADLKLVSQVEFNQAVKAIFDERGWSLLKPSAVGIPWQTNLDLDKWMVSWTCLLTPEADGMGSWPSKSTLIHYNYALMHINSSAIKSIQNHGQLTEASAEEDANAQSLSSGQHTEPESIAVSAATTMLKMSTTDSDILTALQYVPIHVHMMLYYAALLLLHSISKESSQRKRLSALSLVRSLRSVIASCSSRQQQLTGHIIEGLTSAMAIKASISQDINLDDIDSTTEEMKRITGWPGSISSHRR